MSTWHALNVESDHEEEDEVDDTKEIQIEEALKLYQTALKLHSEGPPAFEKAAEAYKELFDSEIFKYAESLSEFKRHELYADTLVFDSILQDDLEAGPVQSVGGNESAPNTLPQILHLSYKNHGQFLLETMQYWIREHGAVTQQVGASQIGGALSYFGEALDKEDTDLDLWLRTASVAAMLGSQRITRFCLEAVLDGNDELYDNLLPLPGLEEGFAGQQLRELVVKLEDNLSLMQTPLSNMKRKKLSETLKKRLNPYPFAPLPAEIAVPTSLQALVKPPERVKVIPTRWDWAGVGESILLHYMAEQSGLTDNVPPGSCLTFSVPQEAHLEQAEHADSALIVEEIIVAAPEETPQLRTENPVAPASQVGACSTKGSDDTIMEDHENSSAPTKTNEGVSATPVNSAAPLPSRKRSTDSAGLPETAEGSRTRSKRLKARGVVDTSVGADPAGQDGNKQQEDQLWARNYADQCLYEVINDMSVRLGVETLGNLQMLRDLVTNATSGDSAGDSVDKAACDLYSALQNSGSSIAPVLLSAEPIDLGVASREAGLNAFLGHSKAGNGPTCARPILQSENLTAFVRKINEEWLSTKEVAFAWLEMLLSPESLPVSGCSAERSTSSYMQYRWAEDLKRHLVQIIVNFDDFIYELMSDRLERLNNRILRARETPQEYRFTNFDDAQVEILGTLFELHLDIYCLIKHPNSGVDAGRKTLQNDSLERWAALSREAMQLRSDCDPDIGMDELALRHIWASVFQMSVNDDILPEHVIYAMSELKTIFGSLDGQIIHVQNNAVMPELSVAAVDRELVRISMKDFFLKVFDTDEKDPVAVIESLEPILESISHTAEPDWNGDVDLRLGSRSPSTIGDADATTQLQTTQPSPVKEMRKFLDSASVNLRLSLWQRLREAYEGIDYPPKVLSCYLRSIETLTGEFRTSTYQDCALPERHTKLISRLRIVDEVVVKVLQIIRGEADAFACLSYEHMQSSMSAIFQMLRIMSGANFLQDKIRIGQLLYPRIEGLPPGTFANMINRLDDIQMRLWILQYYLFKEGMSQNPMEFPIPSDDAFEFLRHVHHATGVRCFSHAGGRLFLRLAKDELLRLDNITEASNRDAELSQVLNDLYGLKTFVDPLDCQEYASVPDILDKKVATSLLPFIMSQADKVGIKDISKHDIKTTIDKVHGTLGLRSNKIDPDIALNSKIIKAYFKSPINPVTLFTCLKGIGSLSTKHIPTESSVPASLGWFFLMGNISLNKFRSQKRQGPGSTEDIHFGQEFFVKDLEVSIEKWETWYRLAQAKDLELEEAVSWTADKINNNNMDLINLQRGTIHCYTMAVACAVRDADPSPQTRAKVAQMHTEFGNRIYASTREPFSMNAYAIKDTEHKFYSGSLTQNVYQDIPFKPLSTYTAWKFASVLFKRAIRGDPENWWNYYMLGKCLWKMYCSKADAVIVAGAPPPPNDGPIWEEVRDAIVNAIETLPEKKERGREPILEPHYKLASITHKLFQRKAIDYRKGAEILEKTSFAQHLFPNGADDWERYMLAVLKALRAADKASWHHRIIARAAHVIYDDSNDVMVAHGAKHELTQQMFTKTMAVQVWRPENERPGRHFVYTSRYTKFFIHLLDQTGDKTNMELLAKRVRKKQTDFFEHIKLWQELCSRYLKLLRRIGQIPDGHEDTVFRALNFEEYNVMATRLEAWCQNPVTQNSNLDLLRDVVELKRVNNGLVKSVLIDDLLGDTFALLYATVGPTLTPLSSEQQPKQLATPNSSAQHSSGSPYVSSLMQVQLDGNNENQSSSNSPFNMFHPSQLNQPPPLQPQQPADPVAKTRPKPVGRREIQRRAEVCAQKPAGAAAPATLPYRSPPQVANAALPSLNNTTRTSPDKEKLPSSNEHQQQQSSLNEQTHMQVQSTSSTVTAAASIANVDSAPASVHDSADDESELSEMDEEQVQHIGQEAMVQVPVRSASVTSRPSLFPGLIRAHERDARKAAAEAKRDDGGEGEGVVERLDDEGAGEGDEEGDEMDTT